METSEASGLPRYAVVARYRTVGAATSAYRRVEAVLSAATTLVDLSAFNIQLNGVPFVAVVGEPPPTDVHERLRRMLARGIPATLPEPVLSSLQRRREQESQAGPWVEKHHRPGKRLPVEEG